MKNRRKRPKDRASAKRRRAVRIALGMSMPKPLRERMMRILF